LKKQQEKYMQEQEQQERTLNDATPSEQCRNSNDEIDVKSEEIVENEKNAECREENEECPCDDKVVNNNGNTGKALNTQRKSLGYLTQTLADL
jgi:hypothetical protein